MGKLKQVPGTSKTKPAGANGRPPKWTDAMNYRRFKLIDKEIAGTLTSREAQELSRLQQQMLDYRRHVAPLPLEDARKLRDSLLKKAAAAKKR